jgi:hypothetical protein
LPPFDVSAPVSYPASRLLSDVSAKVLNSTEDAHTKSMSTFETDEHLQGLRHHAPSHGVRWA